MAWPSTPPNRYKHNDELTSRLYLRRGSPTLSAQKDTTFLTGIKMFDFGRLHQPLAGRDRPLMVSSRALTKFDPVL